jgi:hypothetical protein
VATNVDQRTPIKLRIFDLILKVAILPMLMMLGGCASDRALITLSPVGPKSGALADGDGPGHLIVFNASHETVSREGAMAYPHDDYKIYNERRACIKRVRNRGGAEGELPARVDLPPGEYTVIARSEKQGDVIVPVMIKSGRTTEVNLEQPTRIITPSPMASN